MDSDTPSPPRAHPAGALAFLNPTRRYYPLTVTAPGETPSDVSPIYHVWRSRDNRKGRHPVLVPREIPTHKAPPPTSTLKETTRGILKVFTRFPVWDVSYDVAVIFTLGCVVWVMNGFFVWYPLAAPWTEFSGEEGVAGGWTAFVGATIFEVGSVLLMLEAINENRTECFGWALESALENHTPQLHPTPEACHHHHNKHNWLRKHATIAKKSSQTVLTVPSSPPAKTHPPTWIWYPSIASLRTHYLRETGFLACLFQLLGASIFWISGFTAIPQINSALSNYTPALNGAYWLPQVVGGTGFIISSVLFMLEVQEKWWLPAPKLLGWHVGFWNLVGAIGFTVCGALGFGGDDEAIVYALTLSTFVGSWAFLIGSVVQWYESLDKYPVDVGDVDLQKATPS